ncbi:hypothetical protein LPJ63_002513 [Coemansia sp. RSA 2711]|nr:hypothetical protein LPJ63_002513 [Coemansia sp. RSA 2711]
MAAARAATLAAAPAGGTARQIAHRRLLQTQRAAAWHLDAAVVFDIDGVLVRGQQTIDEARGALRMLAGDNRLGLRIPFALLTNGGGVSEAAKAEQLSRKLDAQISADQIILAHSPMKALARTYADKHVLIAGGPGRQCAEIARSYGFANVSTPDDVVAWQPAAWPFMELSDAERARAQPRDFARHPFAAVMLFHDSFNFGRDLQVITDVLRSQDARLGAPFADCQSAALYMSNADLVFSNEYARPRLAQGAFHVCLQAMWDALTNRAPLQYTRYGKPFAVQYQYAERLLDEFARQHGQARPGARRVYAVGDNPAADIAGANAAGWTSVLVRTGVFSGANDATHPAAMVVDHVGEAVARIIDAEHRLIK